MRTYPTEGPQQVSRDPGFPYLKLGIRDLKAKSGRVSGLKCVGGGMPKITLGIIFWIFILGRDYGIIEESYWDPQYWLGRKLK